MQDNSSSEMVLLLSQDRPECRHSKRTSRQRDWTGPQKREGSKWPDKGRDFARTLCQLKARKKF